MNKKLYKLMNWPGIEGIVYCEEKDPFSLLGQRQSGANVLIQAYLPGAESADLIVKSGKTEKKHAMELADDNGYFAALIPGKALLKYEFEITKQEKTVRMKDAYSYDGYFIGGKDAEKIKAGNLSEIQNVLGASVMTVNGTEGVRFSVYAPNALGVTVSGDFNNNNPYLHQMKYDADLGLYELFVPDAKPKDKYIYNVKRHNGQVVSKLDPYSKQIDINENMSVVYSSEYVFDDENYIKTRSKFGKKKAPMSVYEISLNSFSKEKDESCDYAAIAKKVVKYVKDTGYTHVSLLPVSEFLDDQSAGYKVLNLYSVTNRYGDADGFKKFVDILHQNDIGVIVDYDITSFDSDDLSLGEFDGTPLYESPDPRISNTPFGDRKNYDHSKKEVANYLLSNASYLLSEYHLDGLKFVNLSYALYYNFGKEGWDTVYNMYGGNENLSFIDLIKKMTDMIHKNHPDVLLLAEEVTGFPLVTENTKKDGLGFDLKINNGFTFDYLSFICDSKDKRTENFNLLSESMAYEYSEEFVNALSHNEFLNGYPSMIERLQGNVAEKFSDLKISFVYMFTRPGRKLIFEGQDIGTFENFEFDHEFEFSLLRRTDNKGLRALVRDLNKLYKNTGAFHEFDDSPDGFEWINAIPDDKRVLSFIRKTKKADETHLVVINFSDKEQEISVGSPLAGKYRELINTDDKEYGGKGRVNARNKAVNEKEADGREFSIELKLAPLSASVLKYIPFTEDEKFKIEKKKEASYAKTKASEYAELAKEAEEEALRYKAQMEEAKKKMKEADERAKKLRESENAEIERAKRALAQT